MSCCHRERLVELGELAAVAVGAERRRRGQVVAVAGRGLVARLGSGTR
jgi:hypothetical protein